MVTRWASGYQATIQDAKDAARAGRTNDALDCMATVLGALPNVAEIITDNQNEIYRAMTGARVSKVTRWASTAKARTQDAKDAAQAGRTNEALYSMATVVGLLASVAEIITNNQNEI